MSDTFTDSKFKTDGNGIATFTMNRPDVLNALTPGLKNDYIRMLDMVQGNDAVKALIITGTGRGFSAGGNVKGMGDPEQSKPENARSRMMKMHEWLVRLHNLDCPVIAAVNGLAFGGGLALALQADFDGCLGPNVRRALFSQMVDEGAYFCRMFASGKSLPARLAYRAVYPMAKGLIKKANGITDQASIDQAF